MNQSRDELMNTHNSLTASSKAQAPPPLPARASGEYVIDGSGPATEDEIRELQQIEDFFRQYDCLPENYRPLSEDAHVHYKEKQEELDDWAKSLAAGLVRGYNRQDFLATWVEHFDQPEETNCTDPTSGTGTSDGTAEVQ